MTAEEERVLKAEVEILRSSVKRLKNENTKLRLEQSNLLKRSYEREEDFEKRIAMFEKESQLQRSQRLLAGQDEVKGDVHTKNDIDMRHALREIVDFDELCSSTFIERMKFFRDYFFDDFCTLDISGLISKIRNSAPKDEYFVELFLVFGCRREFFDLFHRQFFSLHGFSEEKEHVLENVPVTWMLNGSQEIESSILAFARERMGFLITFYILLSKKRPTLLPAILTKEAFNEIIMSRRGQWWQLACSVCTNCGDYYVTAHNLHIIPQEALKKYLGSQYVDLSIYQ